MCIAILFYNTAKCQSLVLIGEIVAVKLYADGGIDQRRSRGGMTQCYAAEVEHQKANLVLDFAPTSA